MLICGAHKKADLMNVKFAFEEIWVQASAQLSHDTYFVVSSWGNAGEE